jgi:hypothetical protein
LQKIKSVTLFLNFFFIFFSCKERSSQIASVGLNESKATVRKVLKVCFVTAAQAQSYQEWYEGKGYAHLPTNPVKGIHAADVALIKSIVEQEFKPTTTGLTFSGFQDCEGPEPSNEKSNVYVFRSASKFDEPPGLPQIMSLNVDSRPIDRFFSATRFYDSYDNNVAFSPVNTWDIPHHIYLGLSAYCNPSFVPDNRQDDCVKLDALHEFGHIAGLGHAHNHPDAAKDPACKKEDGTLIEGTGVVPAKDQILSSYTPNSVMNYCHEDLYIAGKSQSAIKSVKLLPQEQAYIKERTRKYATK